MTEQIGAHTFRRREARPSRKGSPLLFLLDDSSVLSWCGPLTVKAALALGLILAITILCASSPSIAQGAIPPSQAVRLHLAKAQEALKSNTPATAEAEFRAVLAIDPKNVEALANLGVVAFFRGDCSTAVTQLDAALAVAPTLVKAKALVAVCEKRMGRPSARADLESVFAQLTDAKLRIQVGVELADLYYQDADIDHTLPVIHALIELDPENVDLLFFAQRVYTELADSTTNKLALLAPDSARMQQLIAERLVNEGDLKNAIDHYRRALVADPRLPGMHFELAEAILQGTNDPSAQAAAKQELDAAVKADGPSAKIESAYGRIALMQGQSAEAYAHFHRSYEMNPNNAAAELGMAGILVDQGKPQEALEYLRSATRNDPLNALAHYRLARVCHSMQLADEERIS